MKEYVDKLINELDSNKRVRKINVHSFDSGAFMIDVWVDSKFYCIQFFDNKFGFSKIDEGGDMGSIPDNAFYSFNAFTSKLHKELNRR
jgi:hypothetical protein